MMNEEMAHILNHLITLSSLPLKSVETKFAIDSTGFRTTTFSDYCREKHNTSQEHEWIKCHIMCGVKTNIVVGAEITEGNAPYCPKFIPLVQSATNNGFNINEVSADKACSSRDNIGFIDSVGGTAFIPFKSSATGKPQGKSHMWRKMYDYFTFNGRSLCSIITLGLT